MIPNILLAERQQKLQFICTIDPTECVVALGSAPEVGGYGVIRRRHEGLDETEVNLESLFEFAYTNPETVKTL